MDATTPHTEPGSSTEPPGFDGPAVVEQLRAGGWMLREPLRYRGRTQEFTVPAGSRTDFASVPRVLAWLVPKLGRFARPAILHDYLWRVAVPAERLTYREADAVLRQALRLCDVPFVLRWLSWTGTRWAALLTRPRSRAGWWPDAGLVLLCSALAAPIVVPPAALIPVALLLVTAVESLLWLPLRLLSKRKKVNPPTVGTST